MRQNRSRKKGRVMKKTILLDKERPPIFEAHICKTDDIVEYLGLERLF